MPKHLIKRYCPSADAVKQHRHLKLFGGCLHSPNLWHLNRRSVARGFANGLFWALVPFPGQVIGVVATALFWGANVPISLLLVFITNPLTMAPIFYFTYLFGTWVLRDDPVSFPDELTFEWFWGSLGEIGPPLFVGSLSIGFALAVTSYYLVSWLWQRHVWKSWRERHQRKKRTETQ